MFEILLGIFTIYPLSIGSLMLSNIVYYLAAIFRRGYFLRSISLLFGLLFAFWVLIGAIFSTLNLGLSFGTREFVQLCFSVQYLFLAYHLELNYKKIYKWMAIAGLVLSLLIVIFFFITGTYAYGVNFMANQRMWGESIFPAWPNGFGAMLSFSLWICLRKHLFNNSFCKFSSALITVAAVLTTSRSAMVGVATVWAYQIVKVKSIGALPKAIAVGIKALVLACCIVVVAEFVFSSASETLSGRLLQISDREEISEVATQLITDRPVFGYGGQTLDQLSSSSNIMKGFNGLRAQHTHNLIFELTLRYGVVGFILFCLFIVSLLTKRVNSPDELVMLTCLLFLSLTQDYARNFCFLLCLYLLIHYEKSNSAPSLMAKSRRSQHERKKKAK